MRDSAVEAVESRPLPSRMDALARRRTWSRSIYPSRGWMEVSQRWLGELVAKSKMWAHSRCRCLEVVSVVRVSRRRRTLACVAAP